MEFSPKKTRKYKVYCCVANCKSNGTKNRQLVFHRLPTKVAGSDDEKRLAAWLSALKLNRPPTTAMRVCSLHFEKSDYITTDRETYYKYLKPDAVPSCNLPLSSDYLSFRSSFNNVCRTCLSASDEIDSLFEVASERICFAQMLMSIAPLKCSENDGLPSQICHKCVRDLKQSYTFQLKCLESDDLLQKKFDSIIKPAEKTNFVEVLIKSESPVYQEKIRSDEEYNESTSLTIEPTYESLNTPLKMADMQNDLDQELVLIKHEIDVKPEAPDDLTEVNIEINRAKRFSCTICDKSFTQRNNLTIHFRSHTGEKPYSCRICERSFNHKSDVTRHEKTHTGEKPYSCSICDKSFNRKPDLTRHMCMHTGKTPFSCTICDKQYKHKSDLTRHIQTHIGDKQYSCMFCDKSFNQKRNLTFHLSTHTGEKPYSCTACNKSFNKKMSLTVHIRTHTGEKSYSCTICDKSFIQKNGLIVHMRSHTGEKPYSCNICDKSFIQKNSLICHTRKHTDAKIN